MSEPKKPSRTSPATGAVAAGLFAALAASFFGSRLWPAMETSSELTFGVMAAAGLLGGVSAYLIMKKRAVT